ncbi:MAG: hypothetical protein ABI416_17130 [Ginsengibacter sp.]
MKKSCLIFCVVACCVYFPAKAQHKKPGFNSINTVGISNGQSGAALLFQTVNGCEFTKWFSGIGIGADYYGYNSFPLFIDVRRYFGKISKGFAYADLGYNLKGKNKPGKEINYIYTSYHFTGGLYTDIGVGYKMKCRARSSFVISAGYSYKGISNKLGVISGCYTASCPVNYSTYKYGNGRVVLRAGVDF